MPASVATAAVIPVEQPLRPFSTPVLVAATDATSVTPQMYVEVFTRDAGGTGGDRAVLLPLNFVPPTLTNPASTRASRATYTQE